MCVRGGLGVKNFVVFKLRSCVDGCLCAHKSRARRSGYLTFSELYIRASEALFGLPVRQRKIFTLASAFILPVALINGIRDGPREQTLTLLSQQPWPRMSRLLPPIRVEHFDNPILAVFVLPLAGTGEGREGKAAAPLSHGGLAGAGEGREGTVAAPLRDCCTANIHQAPSPSGSARSEKAPSTGLCLGFS